MTRENRLENHGAPRLVLLLETPHAPMILAEKENLKAETAVEVLRLREHEMSYYSQSISLMATQATLLAGFTFSAIIEINVQQVLAYLGPHLQRVVYMDAAGRQPDGAHGLDVRFGLRGCRHGCKLLLHAGSRGSQSHDRHRTRRRCPRRFRARGCVLRERLVALTKCFHW